MTPARVPPLSRCVVERDAPPRDSCSMASSPSSLDAERTRSLVPPLPHSNPPPGPSGRWWGKRLPSLTDFAFVRCSSAIQNKEELVSLSFRATHLPSPPRRTEQDTGFDQSFLFTATSLPKDCSSYKLTLVPLFPSTRGVPPLFSDLAKWTGTVFRIVSLFFFHTIISVAGPFLI